MMHPEINGRWTLRLRGWNRDINICVPPLLVVAYNAQGRCFVMCLHPKIKDEVARPEQTYQYSRPTFACGCLQFSCPVSVVA